MLDQLQWWEKYLVVGLWGAQGFVQFLINLLRFPIAPLVITRDGSVSPSMLGSLAGWLLRQELRFLRIR